MKRYENMWVTTSYKMAALCRKMVAEQNYGPCVCSGKGLPVVRCFWVNWTGQLVLPPSHRALCQQVESDILQNGDPTGAERDGIKKAHDWKGGGTCGARR